MCATCHFSLAGCGLLAYTRPMSIDESIFAAYAITALLVGGLCVVTWVRAVRVNRALVAQERGKRS